VLVREARTAGTKVATTATPRATATTSPTVDIVEGHRAWAADEAGAGIGEQWCRQPSDRQPCRRREEGDDDVLGEEQSTAATRLGVPPTALSSPTRLIWSAIRAPTSTAIVATRGQAEQPAAEQQGILFVLKHLVV
jgi:hypothetical protein